MKRFQDMLLVLLLITIFTFFGINYAFAASFQGLGDLPGGPYERNRYFSRRFFVPVRSPDQTKDDSDVVSAAMPLKLKRPIPAIP